MTSSTDADRYVDYVRRIAHEREALAFSQLRLESLTRFGGDFIPRVELIVLMQQVEHQRRGYGIRNWASGTCECPRTPDSAYRGRCTGCGAALYADMVAHRRVVEGWMR